MATAEVAVQPAEATDVETRPYHSIISPDRKRKQQTPEGLNRGRGKMSRSDEYDSPSPPLDTELDQVYPSAHSSTSASGTAGESNASSRGGAGEETLTLRRREANRLAAQRFRSRKKGYQDSLEERIKILEDEKDIIARRLAQTRHQPTTDEGYYRQTETYRRRSPTPERAGDGDVRMASLESANRRLQDELRGVVEDNDRLRDEVERWRKWEREQREPRREEYSRGVPTLPPLDFGPRPSPSYTSSAQPYTSPSHASGFPSRPQPVQRGHSYTQQPAYHPTSPGLRLAPLRLPSSGALQTSRPLLPRPESMERLGTASHALPPRSSPNRRE